MENVRFDCSDRCCDTCEVRDICDKSFVCFHDEEGNLWSGDGELLAEAGVPWIGDTDY